MQEAEQSIRRRYEAVSPVLDEQARRWFAAAEAIALGYGGVSLVARATGIVRSTINRGIKEIKARRSAGAGRIRKVGGGRKKKTDTDANLAKDLKDLVEPHTRGDPVRALLWTTKSLDHLAAALKEQGHSVCPNVVRDLLRGMKYSLQSNRKTREGNQHEDRDAQFQYINALVEDFLGSDDPVLSVDTKKKELVGDFKNNGREWRPKGAPEPVKTHDFIDRELGRAVPYGVYDIANNTGFVSVGNDHDTSSFAVNAIRRWWDCMGKERFPRPQRLMINADGGGSNGYRVRLWKVELQALANELKIPITVCHLPPGTSRGVGRRDCTSGLSQNGA